MSQLIIHKYLCTVPHNLHCKRDGPDIDMGQLPIKLSRFTSAITFVILLTVRYQLVPDTLDITDNTQICCYII